MMQAIPLSAQECTLIMDMTGDTTALGLPVQTRDFQKGPGQFEFDSEYHAYIKAMHGREVRIAFSKQLPDLDETTRQNFAFYIFNIWDSFWRIYGGFPFDSFSIIFRYGPARVDGGWSIGYEVPYPYAAEPHCRRFLSHTHETFHAWWFGGGSDSAITAVDRWREAWTDGINDYYMDRTYALFKNNIRNLAEAHQDFNNLMRGDNLTWYLQKIKGTADDIPTIEMGKWAQNQDDRRLHSYRKGALIGYLLDKILHEDGTSLDALIRYLYHHFNHGLLLITSEDIRDAAGTLTGKDYTQFFNDYVFGNTALPVDVNTQFNLFQRNTKDDFDRDGYSDFLWHHRGSGDVALWSMKGSQLLQPVSIRRVSDTNWRIVGTPDLNGDGKPDLLWQHQTSGQIAGWYMNGVNFQSAVGVNTIPDTNWKIVGTPDLNADGKPDILWQHQSGGQVVVWYMDGVSLIGSAGINTIPDTNWLIVATPDLNADGKPDILWQHQTSGQVAVWYMDGATLLSAAVIATVPDTNWKIVGAHDISGDNKPDLIWHNQATGELAVWYMADTTLIRSEGIGTVGDTNWTVAGPR